MAKFYIPDDIKRVLTPQEISDSAVLYFAQLLDNTVLACVGRVNKLHPSLVGSSKETKEAPAPELDSSDTETESD